MERATLVRRVCEQRQALMGLVERELERAPRENEFARLVRVQRELRERLSGRALDAFGARFAGWEDDRLRRLLAALTDLHRQTRAYLDLSLAEDEHSLVPSNRVHYLAEIYSRMFTLGRRDDRGTA